MPFSYAVPLSTFDHLLNKVDKSRHQEFLQRIKSEIHADLGRRMTAPDMATPTGWARTFFDSTIAHGDLIFYSPMDYEQVVEKTGAPRPTLSTIMFPVEGMKQDPQTMLLIRNSSWRYPGDAGDGMFSQSVSAVLSSAHALVKEFRR